MAATTHRTRCDLVLRHGQLITMDAERRVIADGGLAVAGSEIVAVGTTDEVDAAYWSPRTIEAGGQPVHPGLIDLHLHSTFTTTRGSLPDLHDFAAYGRLYNEWLDLLTPEDEYAACLLTSVELALRGTTFFLDPGTVFDTDAAAAAVEAVGIRATLADAFLWDLGDRGMASDAHALKRAPTSHKRALDLLGGQLGRNDDPGALVRGHVAVFGIGSVSDALLAEATACARERGAIVTMHQSFRADDAADDDARLGRHPLVHYHERELVGPHSLFAHMNVVRTDEHDPIVDSGMSVAWCPAASMNWGVGAGARRPHAELIQRGVTVGLGSDLAKYGLSSQGSLAYMLARDGGGGISAEQVLELSTVKAARALHLDDRLGSLEPGKQADLVVHAPGLPEAAPGLDVFQRVVLAAPSLAIDSVIVAGRPVVSGGRTVNVDEQAVAALARQSAERVRAQMGFSLSTHAPEAACASSDTPTR